MCKKCNWLCERIEIKDKEIKELSDKVNEMQVFLGKQKDEIERLKEVHIPEVVSVSEPTSDEIEKACALYVRDNKKIADVNTELFVSKKYEYMYAYCDIVNILNRLRND